MRKSAIRPRAAATCDSVAASDGLEGAQRLADVSRERLLLLRVLGPAVEGDLEHRDACLGGKACRRLLDAAAAQRPGHRRTRGGQLDELALAQLGMGANE